MRVPYLRLTMSFGRYLSSPACPTTTLARVTIFDPLVAAFCEYTVGNWDVENWRTLGRETSTSEILSSHDRLYRSQRFGDEDYIDAAQDVLPQVLEEATDSSPAARMAFIADHAPDLITWLSRNGNYRTRQRFGGYLEEWASEIPVEWADTPLDVSASPRTASKQPSDNTDPDAIVSFGSAQSPQIGWGISPTLPAEIGSTSSQALTVPDASVPPENIFIVHGRDVAAVREVQLFVHNITGRMPQSLADQPGGGDTIIEKFEREAATSDYAIVLLTPDDEGRIKAEEGEMQDRARQNVIFELGYFFGKLGRRKVLVLNGGVERPSDVHGLSYIAFPGLAWKEDMRRELRRAGFDIIS